MQTMQTMTTLTRPQIVADAIPAQHFDLPPYKAELFNPVTGWAGVMNRIGFNSLRFASSPGSIVTDMETAQLIAEKWNQLA